MTAGGRCGAGEGAAPADEVELPLIDQGAELPPGVLAVRMGPGANCSSAGSAIDVLFYGSMIAGALAAALAAALPPRAPEKGAAGEGGGEEGREGDET